jgi:hypothetical protein
MDSIDVQPSLGAVLLLAERQHGLVTSAQLRGLGLHPKGSATGSEGAAA